ncbi:MAG: signal peptidase I [Actinobacteria bacterium]|nr:signal peptidase I [Actinomycetota bacterium]
MTERSAVRREGLADGALAALRFVVTVGVLFLFTRAFVAESFVVRGESMLPTLRDGDRLLVEKLGHRFGAPKYGEIVVFRPPGPVLGRGRYVKRVIGPPGETVELRGGRVLLSGRAVHRDAGGRGRARNGGPWRRGIRARRQPEPQRRQQGVRPGARPQPVRARGSRVLAAVEVADPAAARAVALQ